MNPAAIRENVRRILKDYDFIISVERFDESIVAMKLLLNLEATDVLYLPSKISGGSKTYTPTKGNKECVLLQKSFTSEPVASHLASDEWYAKEYGDYYVLMEAVKQSLENATTSADPGDGQIPIVRPQLVWNVTGPTF